MRLGGATNPLSRARLNDSQELAGQLEILGVFRTPLGTVRGAAVTDRTNTTGLPVTGVFWHLPFEPF